MAPPTLGVPESGMRRHRRRWAGLACRAPTSLVLTSLVLIANADTSRGDEAPTNPEVLASLGVAVAPESPPGLQLNLEPSLGWRVGRLHWHLRGGVNLVAATHPLSDDQSSSPTRSVEARLGPTRWRCRPGWCGGWSIDLGGQYLDWAGTRSGWVLADGRGRIVLGRPVGLELSVGVRSRVQVSSSVEERVSVGLAFAVAVIAGF